MKNRRDGWRSITLGTLVRAERAAKSSPAQPELAGMPAPQPTAKAGPDPFAKPTWIEWLDKWDHYRRILNDPRVGDSAFRLWHWFDNCKNRNGEVDGFRSEAW